MDAEQKAKILKDWINAASSDDMVCSTAVLNHKDKRMHGDYPHAFFARKTGDKIQIYVAEVRRDGTVMTDEISDIDDSLKGQAFFSSPKNPEKDPAIVVVHGPNEIQKHHSHLKID